MSSLPLPQPSPELDLQPSELLDDLVLLVANKVQGCTEKYEAQSFRQQFILFNLTHIYEVLSMCQDLLN